jgi:hypothetical protein
MRFRPSRPQRTVVRATEEVALFASQAALGNTSYRINPGNAVLFPYLSVQAKQWEFYRFKKLRFMFVTRTATDANGMVILSPDYDNKDANPGDEKELMNTKDAVQDSLWKDVICDLDPKMMYSQGPRKKISDSLMYDRDLYDSGVMRIATQGDVIAVAGALFVEYECELMVPSQPENNTFGETFNGLFATNGGVVQNLTTATPALVAFDTGSMFGDQVGLTYSSGQFAATTKSKWLVNADVSVAGSTAASAFIGQITVKSNGSWSDVTQKVSPPADTGAHYHALTTSAIVELEVGQVLWVEVVVTAVATPTVQTASICLTPY